MTDEIQSHLQRVKNSSYNIALLKEADRNDLLKTLANTLRSSQEIIITENAKDLAAMSSDNPMYDRLLLSNERIESMAKDIESVISLKANLDCQYDQNLLANGLKIAKRTVPLGVVAVIYESRPNVTIDVFTLCFKTGNACILKGGKEANHSNKILTKLIQQTLEAHSVDLDCVYLLPANREAMHTVLNATGLVDVCIPRGSQSLINFVREYAKIPVIETGAGIVHTYFDANGDIKKGRAIINNAKTRRISVCNALDCLIIHQSRLPDLAELTDPLKTDHVEIFADTQSYNRLKSHYPDKLLHHAKQENFGHEFLDFKLAIKTVASIEEALIHIKQYSSCHSEAIITEDESAKDLFLTRVDAAAVYVNASTAFTDGAQFGLGAEIGISTQKLHARGPMALEALTTYKWIIQGNGQIRP